MHLFSSSFKLISQILHRFIQKNCFAFASNLTFSTLLAIVPFMLVSVSILSIFPVFSQWTHNIENFILKNFLPASAENIQMYFLTFLEQTTKLSVVSIASLLLSVALVLFNIEQTFNAIWQVKHRRKGIISFLLYYFLVAFFPLLMGLSFALTNYFISFPFIAHIANKLAVIFLWVVPFFISSTIFTILYVIIPNCRVPIRYAVLSGTITGLLFEVAKYVFSLYLHFFNTYKIIYGALAAFPIFLVWIYLSWLLILLGVEICHSLTVRRAYSHGTKDAGTFIK